MIDSSFKSHHETFEIAETKYSLRILKMKHSNFIYIGFDGRESLETIGLAMPVADAADKVISTTALGPQLGYESQQLAEKLVKRLHKPIYVSCNIPFDRLNMPKVEEKLVQVLLENPEIVC